MSRAEERHAALVEEIRDLKSKVSELRGERDSLSDELRAGKTVKELREEIARLEIDKGRLVEDNDRKIREVEHMVGLQKKRQEVEMKQAEQGARLAVREENLTADRERFDKHVEFIEARFTDEVKYLKEIMSEILGRLPTVSIDRTATTPKARTRAA